MDLEGALDRVEPDGVIEGWCRAPARPGYRVEIELRADGVIVATSVCREARPDLAARGIGDGGHGFLLVLPPELLRPGVSAQISMHERSSGRPVGQAVEVTWSAASPHDMPQLQGHLDEVTLDGRVSGWCWYPSLPGSHVTLSVLVDDEVVGAARAVQFRPDLLAAGIGDGSHGFSYALPWAALEGRGRLTVTVIDATTSVPLGSPVLLRLGSLSASEDRVLAMERQIRHLRAEIAQLSAELDRREGAGPTQAVFATIGALFNELGAAARPEAIADRSLGDFSLRSALDRMRLMHQPISLAIPADPAATVVIPATADLPSIHGCLAAVHEAGIDQHAEIVLLDCGDGPAELALLPGLVRNLRMMAWDRPHSVGACMAALASADRRPVAWLSPLLRPQFGWLDNLVATLERESLAGLVGGRVVGSDGLQRDGGWLADAQGQLQPVGAMDEADRPELCFMREVDAVAGLGFIVRPEAMAGIVGGDAPALCDGLRRAGWRLLLQPQAIAECEEATFEDRIGARQLGLEAVGARAIGQALVVDSALPRPDRDAGSLATLEQLQLLRRLGYHVVFAAASGIDPSDPAGRHLESLGIELVRAPAASSVTAWLLQHGGRLDVVQVWRHANAAQFLDRVRALAPQARLIFSPADLHHVREGRRIALGSGFGVEQHVIRDEELACARSYDATIVHSDTEFDLLRGEVEGDRLRLMRWIAHPAPAAVDFLGRSGICFLGSFSHSPNEDALRWFLGDILPLLRRMRAGLVFHVAGAGLPADLTDLGPDVVVHGWVQDLAGLFAGVRLSVAPLRYGAGFKGKVATSLAFGVPVVGTGIAIEGTGLFDGDGIAVADEARDFADAILRMHDSETLWRAQSARAVERCRALYAPEAALEVYRSLFAELDLPREAA